MKLDYYEYTIAECFVPAIVQGEVTHLSDEEEAQFNDWIESTDRQITHWECIGDGENFTRCEVTNLHAQCMIVRGYFYTTE